MSNYLEGVFQPAYSFDNALGFQTRLDTSLNGNVTIGNSNTNYSLMLNGLPVGSNVLTTGYWSYLCGGGPSDQTINESITLGSGTQVQWSNIQYESTPALSLNTTWTTPYKGWYNITLNLDGRNVLTPANDGVTVICYNQTTGQQLNPPVRFVLVQGSSGTENYTTSATYMTSLNLNDVLIFMGGANSPLGQCAISPSCGLNIHLLGAL
jgi:hypothetical protein